MASILADCHDFNFSESYAYADMVRKHILDDNCIIEITDLASDFENQIRKPQKWTLLHDYIEYIISNDIEFNFGGPGWDYDCIEPLFPILDSHGVQYKSLERYVSDLYSEDGSDVEPDITAEMLEENKFEYALEYFNDVALQGLVPVITKEVFTLLFSDRNAMMKFNLKIAEEIGEKTARCTYWPAWLKTAIFCREKGLCAICKCDLTAVWHATGKLAIDHIVPINLYGVNDPTNLQVLCQSCNGTKSGGEVVTSNVFPVYWK